MEKIDEKAIIGRIKNLRIQHFGVRGKSNFARALGISPSTYNYYEDNRVPPIETLLKMCEVTGVDIYWLLMGQTKSSASQNLISSLSPGIVEKLDSLITKHPETAEAISAFIELLCEKKGIEKEFQIGSSQDKPACEGWIPVLGRTAAGIVHCWSQQNMPKPEQVITELDELVKKHVGKSIIDSSGGSISIDLQIQSLLTVAEKPQANFVRIRSDDTQEISEFVECAQIRELFTDSFALHIDGDSMSPKINDGDIVILSPSVPAKQGQTAVAKITNQIGVTCKLIRTTEQGVHLIPINEKYDTKVVAKEELLWSLAVLCHISL